MGIRKLKPTTPGQRGMSVSDFAEITRTTPEKSLVRPIHSKGGRNSAGRITVRHQGGGHKRNLWFVRFTARVDVTLPDGSPFAIKVEDTSVPIA